MLWAAHRESRKVFYLEDGAAPNVRATILSDLVCVVPDCPAPTITVVAYQPGRRQCFRHNVAVAGEAHAMGLFHLQGQAEIEKWLTAKYERSVVAREVPINGNRDRIADVMITATTGERVSFEVQYASLSNWEDRHTDYVSAGIPDVWLFGHVGSQLKLTRDGLVRLGATHRAAAKKGLHVLWFNPVTRTLATATVPRFFPHSGVTVDVPIHGADTIDATLPDATLHLFPLESACVGPGGLRAPVLQELDHVLEDAVTREADAVAAAAARAERIAQQRKLEAEKIASRKAATAAKMDRIKTKHDQLLRAWPTHPLRAQVLDQFDGKWPPFLDVKPQGVGAHKGVRIAMPFPHRQWQAELHQKYMRGKADGSVVTIKECTAHLLRLDRDAPLAKEAVSQWFYRLVDLGILGRVPRTWSNGEQGHAYVTRTPTARSRERERALELTAETAALEKEERAARRERENDEREEAREDRRLALAAKKSADEEWRSSLESISELIAVCSRDGGKPPELPPRGECPDCGKGIVGEVNIERGYHPYCVEVVYRLFGRTAPKRSYE